MTVERTYADSLKAYYQAVWARSAENADQFNIIERAVWARTEPYTAVPADLTGKINLEQLNALVTARIAASEAEAAVTTRGVAESIRGNLRGRLLNAEGREFVGGASTIGTLNEEDITAALERGAATAGNLATLTPVQAAPILERWVRGFLEGDTDLPALRRALGVGADVDPSSVAVLQGEAPNQTINPVVLRAFQSAHALEQTGTLDEATISKLRGNRFNFFDEGRRFTQGFVNWIQNGGERPTGAASEARPANETEEGTTPPGNNPFGDLGERFMEFFQGTNAGGWIGGVLGAGLAWFASNMFGAGPFRPIMMALAIPLLFVLGRNMGNNWGRETDGQADAPATDGQAREPRTTALAQQPSIATDASIDMAEARATGQQLVAALEAQQPGSGALVDTTAPESPAASVRIPTLDAALLGAAL